MTTLHVSKLGDNSDGCSWERAFTTIQAALDAVPEGGGCRIVIRPDTYMEANLYPAQQGAEGRYNELVGDIDGSLGSGTSGEVIIDSSDPQLGFKSYDWWGSIRSYDHGWSPEHTHETFSAIGWDRWRLCNLYATGGDGGLFFDLTNRVEPFTVIVEDCAGIGRAFGGGVASCLARAEEPITFRRCHLWALDWWGDTAGVYLRVENEAMPEMPDVVLEDCTLVGPQCSLKASNFGFHTYTRVQLTRCRLVTLNFSQPHGTPTDGIIQSVQEGKLLHVDLQDCTLMGYKVFGVIVNKETVGEIGYTTSGDVRAYVQYQQEVPAGMHRLGHFPPDVFANIAPQARPRPLPYVRKELVARDLCELTPFIWQGRLHHLECVRPAREGERESFYLLMRDAETGQEVARLAEGYGLGSVLVHEDTIYAFASRWENGGWHDVTMFSSKDLQDWEQRLVIEGENEELFNTSVCQGPDGFVMAYESNDPTYQPGFTIKFATSPDLLNWTKLPEATFGTNRYAACPCVRYADGYYYVLYLEHRSPRHVFETYLTRSPDLRQWELSAANPVLVAEGLDEGINASDPELVEWEGQTWVYYAAGDQLTWMNLKRALYPGPLGEYLQSWYEAPGVPEWGCLGRQKDG